LIRALPNLISFARLLLVPVILLSIWRRQYNWALILSFAAGVSDALDGFLARRLHAATRLGAYLDPIADKLLLSGTYLVLGLDRVVPWWLTAIVFGRDFLIMAFAAYAILFTEIRTFKPSIWGKLSTVIQIVTALVILLARATDWTSFPRLVEHATVALTVIATVWSAAHYAWTGVIMVSAARVRSQPTAQSR
jgi:cardiolipin synthase